MELAPYWLSQDAVLVHFVGIGWSWLPQSALARRSQFFAHANQRSLVGYCLASTVKPSFLRMATAPAFPPSKSSEPRRWPVASSYAVPKIAL